MEAQNKFNIAFWNCFYEFFHVIERCFRWLYQFFASSAPVNCFASPSDSSVSFTISKCHLIRDGFSSFFGNFTLCGDSQWVHFCFIMSVHQLLAYLFRYIVYGNNIKNIHLYKICFMINSFYSNKYMKWIVQICKYMS